MSESRWVEEIEKIQFLCEKDQKEFEGKLENAGYIYPHPELHLIYAFQEHVKEALSENGTLTSQTQSQIDENIKSICFEMAHKGIYTAQLTAGEIYGLKKQDLETAKHWFGLAAKQGSLYAQYHLAHTELTSPIIYGWKIPEYKEKGLLYLEVASAHGYGLATRDLAWAAFKNKNFEKAFELWCLSQNQAMVKAKSHPQLIYDAAIAILRHALECCRNISLSNNMIFNIMAMTITEDQLSVMHEERPIYWKVLNQFNDLANQNPNLFVQLLNIATFKEKREQLLEKLVPREEALIRKLCNAGQMESKAESPLRAYSITSASGTCAPKVPEEEPLALAKSVENYAKSLRYLLDIKYPRNDGVTFNWEMDYIKKSLTKLVLAASSPKDLASSRILAQELESITEDVKSDVAENFDTRIPAPGPDDNKIFTRLNQEVKELIDFPRLSYERSAHGYPC